MLATIIARKLAIAVYGERPPLNLAKSILHRITALVYARKKLA